VGNLKIVVHDFFPIRLAINREEEDLLNVIMHDQFFFMPLN